MCILADWEGGYEYWVGWWMGTGYWVGDFWVVILWVCGLVGGFWVSG